MTALQIVTIAAVAVGVLIVILSMVLSENALTTKKEKARNAEREEKARKEFDDYLESKMDEIRQSIAAFEQETFGVLSKNAVHSIEVASNEAVEKIEAKTEEVKKQMDDLFEN